MWIKAENGINDAATVKKQYATSTNLNKRISIHDKYSTNRQGFGNWIVSQYRIEPGMRVLELGCGTGSMWKGRSELIGLCSKLVLSDFSEGMLETAKQNVGTYENLEYRVIDIQNIPYEDVAFDIVIANMMLYHVPDLDRGLREVRRVLKPGGTFYTATYGEHGIVEYVAGLLSSLGVEDRTNKVFTLQNGAQWLGRFFNEVRRTDYEDSLAVTDVNDLTDYIFSLTGMISLNGALKGDVREILRQNMQNGVLLVPKEYGLFIAK